MKQHNIEGTNDTRITTIVVSAIAVTKVLLRLDSKASDDEDNKISKTSMYTWV